MAALKQKGDRAELEVARDLIRRGYRIAFPYGEDWDFDLIFSRPDSHLLERVQVKYTASNGAVVYARARSASLTNGKVKAIKRYTAETIDWLAVFDATSDRCYYLPAVELGAGMDSVTLRLTPPKNCQRAGIRYAADYVDPDPLEQYGLWEMEPAGLEPATSALQARRSPN
jgi:PD-(D/E)XK endonuclease